MWILLRVFRKVIFKINLFFVKKSGLKIGENCSFTGFPNFGSEPYLIEIGDDVTVAGNTAFITHDGAKRVADRVGKEQGVPDIIKFGKIKVGNNVFIGYNCIILPGVTIGDNSIVAAGSIVTKDVKSGFIVAGNPAKEISTVDNYVSKLVTEKQKLSESEKLDLKSNKRKFVENYLEGEKLNEKTKI